MKYPPSESFDLGHFHGARVVRVVDGDGVRFIMKHPIFVARHGVSSHFHLYPNEVSATCAIARVLDVKKETQQ